MLISFLAIDKYVIFPENIQCITLNVQISALSFESENNINLSLQLAKLQRNAQLCNVGDDMQNTNE